MIWIGVPDVAALRRVLAKLVRHRIVHYAWEEPDFDFGLTAIAAAPDEVQRSVLENYRVWNVAGIAQLRERQLFKLEVAGENPAPGSTIPGELVAR